MSQAQAVPANDDHQGKIDYCAQNVITFVKADVSLRVPNTEDKRQNAFSEWLSECFTKYRPVIQSELHREFGISEQEPIDLLSEEATFEAQAEQNVWRQVAPVLLSYAL